MNTIKDLDKAMAMHNAAFDIQFKNNKHHPDVALTRTNIARLHELKGAFPQVVH
jgi:hypothetical protein